MLAPNISRVVGVLGLLLAVGCGPKADPQAPQAPARREPEPSSAPKVAIVEGSVIVKDCPAKLDPKQARKTLDALAGDCTSVPGKVARFLATLQPGGRIEISAPDGSDEGTIPICVLKNKLRHKLFIKQECTLEVQIEESAVGGSRP